MKMYMAEIELNKKVEIVVVCYVFSWQSRSNLRAITCLNLKFLSNASTLKTAKTETVLRPEAKFRIRTNKNFSTATHFSAKRNTKYAQKSTHWKKMEIACLIYLPNTK